MAFRSESQYINHPARGKNMPGPRVHCPFCVWTEHTHRVPAHLLKYHLLELTLSAKQESHCVRFFYNKGSIPHEFAVCLSCHKGTMMDVHYGHGMRWVSLHAKQDCCRSAHPAAFDKLKLLVNPIPTLIPVEPEPEPIPTLIPADTVQADTAGWVYCFENDAMPGIYKVGVTRRTPTQRLAEANGSNTWVPSPFRIVMAKHPADAFATEKWLHQRLSEMGFRVNRRREFFNAPLTVLQPLFDQVEGAKYTSS